MEHYAGIDVSLELSSERTAGAGRVDCLVRVEADEDWTG
jgi:hypothetical protein